MGRRKIYTEEEKKERKKKYDIEYQNKKYHEDPEYRQWKIWSSSIQYLKVLGKID